LGPVLIEFGTEAQKRTLLPRILSGADWWCQGFSEPQAGSDLAALQMRAVRDGDVYVVNGTKLWTSWAHMANKIFCLVRTSVEKHKQAGISFLLIDMEQPGVTVSPILPLGGMHAVNEVRIEDVRVPVENLVGGEGDAWEITKFLLGHERLVGAGIGPSLALAVMPKEEWGAARAFIPYSPAFYLLAAPLTGLSVPLVQMNALMGFVSDALLGAILGLGLDRATEARTVRTFSKLLWLQNDLITRHYQAAK